MARPKRLKTLPWAAILQTGVLLTKRWLALSEKERKRLLGLLRDSHGRVSNLSVRERLELRKLLGKLEPKGTAREVRALFPSSKKRKHRH
jgi:hypothetical protein